MEWSHVWLKDERSLKFYETLRDQGKLKEKDKMPDVTVFDFYIRAFHDLETCRGVGMGVCPIPWISIVEYAKLMEVDDVLFFVEMIQTMDRKFLSLQSKGRVSDTRNSQANRNKGNK